MAPDDEFTLTPTQDLLLSVLGGRYRLGRDVSSIPKQFRHSLDGLASQGLVKVGNEIAQGYLEVQMTDAGKRYWLNPNYKADAPALARAEAFAQRTAAEELPSVAGRLALPAEYAPRLQAWLRGRAEEADARAERAQNRP